MAKCVQLESGSGSMPTVGLGTFTAFGLQGDFEAVERAVSAAIDAGYRHVDTAWMYKTQDAIGNALTKKIKEGVIKREDMFITTKLWQTHHSPSLVRLELLDSLKSLQTDYVDMFLMHSPISFQDQDLSSDVLSPADENGKGIPAEHKLEDVWKYMEECQRAGLTRNIGLSNCNSKQIDRILASCTIRPTNLQVEVSPYFSNSQLREFCQTRGIVVTAYAPFGAPKRPWATKEEPNMLDDEILKIIANRKGKTVPQIILRSLLQCGLVVVPKSTSPQRIQENLQVFDFTLEREEMKAIESLNRNARAYGKSLVDCTDMPEYPFNEPY